MKYLKNMKKRKRKGITIYRKDLWDSKQFRTKEFANKMKIEYDGRKPRREEYVSTKRQTSPLSI